MENPPLIDDFPIQSSIDRGFARGLVDGNPVILNPPGEKPPLCSLPERPRALPGCRGFPGHPSAKSFRSVEPSQHHSTGTFDPLLI